jgi:diketogulonate reductase-like aldo/keto reductase
VQSDRDFLFDRKLDDTWKQMENLLETGKVVRIGEAS